MTQRARAALEATAASDGVMPIEPRTSRSWWRLIALLIGALVILFPFYYMIVGSLQKKQDTSLSGAVAQTSNITLHNYGQINAALSLGRTLINSGIFTGDVLLATVVFGVLAGYALAQLRFRGTLAARATNAFGAILAGACVLAAPAVALFIAFQRHFDFTNLGSGVKGSP
jgi:ABC-type glycerol-3-phosphate transport system permease component